MFGKLKRGLAAVGAPFKKIRVPKVVRNTLLSIFILVLLCGALGVAYTFYMGQQAPPKAADAAPVSQVTEPVIKPTKPSPKAPESASVQALTSPVAPGSNASIDIKTLAGSTCKIAVVYNNVPSTDSGLTPKVADDFGTVGWSWTVGPATPLGKWPVTVTCSLTNRTAVVQGTLEVSKQAQP
jgi:hypothetical protein